MQQKYNNLRNEIRSIRDKRVLTNEKFTEADRAYNELYAAKESYLIRYMDGCRVLYRKNPKFEKINSELKAFRASPNCMPKEKSRYLYLAYAFVRGVSYRRVERNPRKDANPFLLLDTLKDNGYSYLGERNV